MIIKFVISNDYMCKASQCVVHTILINGDTGYNSLFEEKGKKF